MADKILKDEILSDDELDNVAGGTTAETMRDVDEFESLGVKVRCTEIGMPLMDRHGETTLNLIDTYKTFGVDVKLVNDTRTPNRYFIDGKEVSHADAWKVIRQKLGN